MLIRHIHWLIVLLRLLEIYVSDKELEEPLKLEICQIVSSLTNSHIPIQFILLLDGSH